MKPVHYGNFIYWTWCLSIVKYVIRPAVFFLIASYPFLYLHAKCPDIHYRLTLSSVIYDATNNNGESTIGYRRLVTNQKGTARSEMKRDFLQVTPNDSDFLSLTVNSLEGWGKNNFTVCRLNNDGTSDEIISFNLEKHQSKHISLEHMHNKRLVVQVQGQTLSNDLSYEMLLDSSKTPKAIDKKRPTGNALGFADIHVHQTADLAFAHGWYFGSHQSDHPETNLGNDIGNHGVHLAGIDVYGSHHDMKFGYPTYEDWPSAYDISHQQVAGDWLKEAHENGLTLMLASVVNNQWLCAAVVASGYHDKGYSCNDMESAKRQINALHKFERDNNWFKIVTDPWMARRVISEGKLAVVIAVEVSNLFPTSDGDYFRQLDELYAMDVRSVQLAHEINSLYAGAALHNDVFKFIGRIKALFNFGVDYATDKDGMHNSIGLTEKGERLIEHMISLNMPIDLAHLSLKAQRNIVSLTQNKYDHYPIFNSHTRILELLPDAEIKKLKEHNTPLEILNAIKESGGIIGLRTGDNRMKSYKPQFNPAVENNCDGSTRSLAQLYLYSIEKGVNTAFASDFNGFITQLVPRFGEHACSSSADPISQRLSQGEQNQNVPSVVKAYQTEGLAHIGLLPAVLYDMKELGVNTTNLSQSTEHFLSMWERAYQSN